MCRRFLVSSGPERWRGKELVGGGLGISALAAAWQVYLPVAACKRKQGWCASPVGGWEAKRVPVTTSGLSQLLVGKLHPRCLKCTTSPRFRRSEQRERWAVGACGVQSLGQSRRAGRAGPALTCVWRASQAAEVWYEGSASQEIVWSMSTDRGLSWGPRRTLVTPASDLPVWAPVLHVQARACKPSLPGFTPLFARRPSWGPRRTLVTPARRPVPVWAPVLRVQARACKPAVPG